MSAWSADGGEEQLDDELLAQVCEAVRPHRRDGHGEAWAVLVANHDQLKTWLVTEGLTAVKAHELLARQGTVVPERTLHRYALEVLGVGRSARSHHGAGGRRRAGRRAAGRLRQDGPGPRPRDRPSPGVQALIFTAVLLAGTASCGSPFSQTTDAVIAGFEAAWTFFDGVFAVVIPDNMATIVDKADATEPRFNQAFVEYAQARGFLVDPARVRTPTDKPRVERTVPFVRNSFFAGETLHRPGRRPAPGRDLVCRNGPGCASTARPSAARPSCSPSRSCPGWPRRRRRPTTCRSTPRPRSTATTTSRWPRRCTRSRAT